MQDIEYTFYELSGYLKGRFNINLEFYKDELGNGYVFNLWKLGESEGNWVFDDANEAFKFAKCVLNVMQLY